MAAHCGFAVVEQTDEEEEEEEPEAEQEEEEEVEEELAKPLPGLGDPSDVMLVEKWHGLFVGQRMEAAATSGHVVCTRSELACYVKIAVPPSSPEVCPGLRVPLGCSCIVGRRQVGTAQHGSLTRRARLVLPDCSQWGRHSGLWCSRSAWSP